jgi:hypothetical protein
MYGHSSPFPRAVPSNDAPIKWHSDGENSSIGERLKSKANPDATGFQISEGLNQTGKTYVKR